MKKNYSLPLFIVLFAFAFNANAQCSACATTIAGADASNHIVNSGTTLCISPSGSASGLITVLAGGTLCNQGTITSASLWVAGGTFNNYGTVNTGQILVSNQGVFNSVYPASVTLDSILITDIYSALNNSGVFTCIKMGLTDNSIVTNNGDITTDYLGDSTAQFNNNFNLTVNIDFGNTYNSGFFNTGYMNIGRDFFNTTGSTFETDCMISVGRDWYNSALILGPPTGSCGGFAITGGSYNSGTLGNASTHLDICDAGGPSLGLDAPGGTIAGTTTFCSCSNACIQFVVGVEESLAQTSEIIQNIYPNPASADLTAELESKDGSVLTVEVIDIMGRKHFFKPVKPLTGMNKVTIDVSLLTPGTYILNVKDDRYAQSRSLFTVVR